MDKPDLININCPKCDSPSWKDKGQVKNMIKLKQVYSNEDYEGSKSGDESDKRDNKYFVRKLKIVLFLIIGFHMK